MCDGIKILLKKDRTRGEVGKETPKKRWMSTYFYEVKHDTYRISLFK